MANENMIQKHEDNFLAKIAGETPIDDNPRNSTEFWLNEIANNLPGEGTTVVANPTLAGTEDPLTGLQVGDTKYIVGSNTKIYLHVIRLSGDYRCIIYATRETPFNTASFSSFLYENGINTANKGLAVVSSGEVVNNTIRLNNSLYATSMSSLSMFYYNISISDGSITSSFATQVTSVTSDSVVEV